jgi:hypothetical protein
MVIFTNISILQNTPCSRWSTYNYVFGTIKKWPLKTPRNLHTPKKSGW